MKGILAGWFLLACVLGYHGFSTGSLIHAVGGDGMPAAGIPQGVRSDDWMVVVPFQLSQWNTTPPYRVTNPSRGDGESFLVTPYPIPIVHWTTAFRPQTWGFFLDFDFGLSWLWNFRVLGCVAAVYFLLTSAGAGSGWATPLAAMATALAPMLQYWSHVPTMHVACFSALLGGTLRFYRQKDSGFQPFQVLAAAYIWVVWALVLYPPFAAPLALLLLLLNLALVVCHFRDVSGRRLAWSATGQQLLAGVIAAAILFLWAREALPDIRAMMNTAYPGRRADFGGGGDWLGWWTRSLIHIQSVRNWHLKGSNVCEVSSVIQFLPVLLGVAWINRARLDSLGRAIFWGVGLSSVFWFIYRMVGFPPMLATVTGMSWSTVDRSVLMLVGLQLPLLGVFLGDGLWDGVPEGTRKPFGVVIVLVAVLGWTAWREIRDLNASFKSVVLTGALVLGYVGVMFQMLLGKKRAAAAGFFAVSALASFAFNPIEFRGFYHKFQTAPVTRLVAGAAVASPGRWMVADLPLNLVNIPFALGLPSLSHVQHFPDRSLWAQLDPEKRFERIWNRYAHLDFRLNPQLDGYQMMNPQADVAVVHFGISYLKRFRDAGVMNFLVPCQSTWGGVSELEQIAQEGENCVYSWRNRGVTAHDS